MDRRLADMQQSLMQWREQLHERMEALDELEASGADEPGDEVPPDAPAEYRAVARKVARGELDWFDVMSGETEDPDARVVHMWMDRRLARVQQAWRLLEQGASIDDAVAGTGGQRQQPGERS
jgi:hypothetical protein